MQAKPQQDSKAGSVTFNNQVLPILQKNCQTCHRPGEIAPMSFLTYSDVRPWAKAIKAAWSSGRCRPGSRIRSGAPVLAVRTESAAARRLGATLSALK